jgi:hypothetical protein
VIVDDGEGDEVIMCPVNARLPPFDSLSGYVESLIRDYRRVKFDDYLIYQLIWECLPGHGDDGQQELVQGTCF